MRYLLFTKRTSLLLLNKNSPYKTPSFGTSLSFVNVLRLDRFCSAASYFSGIKTSHLTTFEPLQLFSNCNNSPRCVSVEKKNGWVTSGGIARPGPTKRSVATGSDRFVADDDDDDNDDNDDNDDDDDDDVTVAHVLPTCGSNFR